MCVAYGSMQKITNDTSLAQNVGCVPKRRRTKGDPAQLLHILNSVSKQTSSKEEEEDAHHTEEEAVVQPIA